MMVSGTTNAAAPSSGSASGTQKTVGKDEFLRLFTTQLRAQDPLNPMDSAGFTAQLAQFSSLEQLTNINAQLTGLLQFQNSLQNMLTTDLLGKRVTLANDEVHAVAGIQFSDNQTYLELDNGSTVQLGDIKAISGGA